MAARACVNATIGFDALNQALGRPPKSLMRMCGLSGNPRAESLLGVGVQLEVRVAAAE